MIEKNRQNYKVEWLKYRQNKISIDNFSVKE